ncbi:MAG: hypothetical protein K2J38_05535, partial [Muribaculaceae bacterium]|nr:hypothetical protein [Muribaculaceae bacterium]
YSAKQNPDFPEQAGGISGSGITLDTSVINQDINSDVIIGEDNIDSSDRPGQEEPEQPGPDQPGPDQPENPEQPGDKAVSFEPYNSPNLNLDEVNDANEYVGNAIILITAPKGIKSLVVTIKSDNPDFEETLDAMHLMPNFNLADVTDPIIETNLRDILHLPYNSAVQNQTEVEFNITDFIPMMPAFTGSHTFTISVTDNDNKCETMSLRFKC